MGGAILLLRAVASVLAVIIITEPAACQTLATNAQVCYSLPGGIFYITPLDRNFIQPSTRAYQFKYFIEVWFLSSHSLSLSHQPTAHLNSMKN